MPHQFITRGNSCKPIELGVGLLGGELCLAGAFPALFKYEENLVVMEISWDWPTCHRWSEKVFKSIADGRLRLGWYDPASIKDLQCDVCTDTVWARTSDYTRQPQAAAVHAYSDTSSDQP